MERMLMGKKEVKVEWDHAELSEVLIAAPNPEDEKQFIFSGDVSDMWKYVFSDSWAEHMYDEYPAYFWEDVLNDLQKRNEITEIVIDMVYDFGEATEEDVRDYMLEYKNEGPRFLIMPRTDTVAMACAYLRSYEVKALDAV
jgi:hypothetical protein